MSVHLDEAYLEWLYSQVLSLRLQSPKQTYWNLLRALYQKEFVWFVPNDDNRISDGKDLRYEFSKDCEVDILDDEWANLGCSMLELLISLSRRLSFLDEREPREWFWHMLLNLGLGKLNDADDLDEDLVDDILERVIWRTYNYEGEGGLFPLKTPHEDQREVELWYQLNAYVLENSD